MKKASVLAIVVLLIVCQLSISAQDFTWKKTEIPSVGINAMEVIEFHCILIVLTTNNKIYALNYQYNNNYESFIELHPDSFLIEYTTLNYIEPFLILGTKNNGIYVSPNGVVNWTRHIIDGLENAEITSISFCYDLTDSNFAVVGTKKGLYRSSEIWSYYTKLDNELGEQEIIAIFNPAKIHFNQFIKIFVSTRDSGVYESNDKGYTYNKINYPFSKSEIIRTFTTNYDTIYAVSDSNIYFYDVFGDTTWKKFENKPPSNEITSIICYNYDSSIVFQSKGNSTQSLPDIDKFMVGTNDKGILNLKDKIWEDKNDGINDKKITSLISDLNFFITGNIFAGTESDGVYRIQLKLLPDPFIVFEDNNSSGLTIINSNDRLVKLKLNLISDDYVNLELYDLQGNKVKDIYRNYLSSGEQQLDLDISDLQSGIYFIKLQVNGKTSVKKMMVAR
ncbi:MAG: T9SS type A sorting domain-containing protein [Ignavibacteriae bacterium]|nr:T9SS type A sorting domain-containing protein [Ignavibacteriota bacterium]